MTTDPSALFERVNSAFFKLSTAAKDLNNVSDELGRAITAIDAVLQRLNLGVAAWVAVHGDRDEQGMNYWSRDIGYAKVNNRWGISLRSREGNYNWPDEEDCETWLFNDAPRWQRVESVEKIPDLLEQLIKDAEATTKRIKEKIDHAKQLADAFEQAASDKAELRPKLPDGMLLSKDFYGALESRLAAAKEAKPAETAPTTTAAKVAAKTRNR